MKTPIKFGDRVIYKWVESSTATILTVKARVIGTLSDDIIRIESEAWNGNSKYVHRNALTRLKPKAKPREFWIAHSPIYLDRLFKTKEMAEKFIESELPDDNGYELVHVREVRKR